MWRSRESRSEPRSGEQPADTQSRRVDGVVIPAYDRAALAVAVHISGQNMTKEEYERVRKELEANGGGDPDGRLYHAAYGDDNVEVFEVWESKQQFDDHFHGLFANTYEGVTARVDPVHSPRPD